MMRRRAAVLVLGSIFIASTAFADEPETPTQTPSERAEALYVQGKQLAQEQRYAEACGKFEESHRLEPAIGTQFNLADCFEHTQKPASALRLFTEVARVARMSGKQDRQKAAEERIAALEKTVPRLRIKVTATVAGMRITRDGEALPLAALDHADAIDPGVHAVTASAPGYVVFERKIEVANAGATVEVVVPALEPVAREPTSPPPLSEERSTLAYVGLGAAALGVVSIGVGTIFGIDALGKKGDAGCDGTDCSAAGADGAKTLRDAQTSGDVSTVFFVVGGVLAAGGAALWFFAPKVRASVPNAASNISRGMW